MFGYYVTKRRLIGYGVYLGLNKQIMDRELNKVKRAANRRMYPWKISKFPRPDTLMKEAASICETSVNFYLTSWRNTP